MECMNKVAYAIALAVALIALPMTAQADDGTTNQEESSCLFFSYTLSPPNVQIDPDCPPITLPPDLPQSP